VPPHRELHGALGRLAAAQPFVRGLETVDQGVARELDEGLPHQRPVGFGDLALGRVGHEARALAETPGEVADEAGHGLEEPLLGRDAGGAARGSRR